MKVSQDRVAAGFGAHVVPSVNGEGMSNDPNVIHQGANSGFQVWNLLMLMGVRRMVLLGFDMSVEQGLHWHGPHPAGLNNPDPDLCLKWRAKAHTAAADLCRAGVEVVNCSRATALTCFPRGDLQRELD